MDNDVAALYYRLQLVCFAGWWAVVRAVTGRHLHAVCSGSVCTRPSWLSTNKLLILHSSRRSIVASVPIMLAIASVNSGVHVRILVAIIISAYHLVESSISNRHGEYPLLYNAWAMCLPSNYAHAAALGIAVHFIVSSGLAKLWVGGMSWMRPCTMRTYLDCYRGSQSGRGPLNPTMNAWISRRAWASVAVSISTIVLECIVVPATLVAPPTWRHVGSIAMMLLHVGIALFMSGQVGLAFLTTLPAYVVGFSCAAEVGSRPWLTSVVIGVGPTAVVFLRGRLLPENWPCCPVALFMWSGSQAKQIAQLLMTGDTRVVLSTAATASRGVRGLPVIAQGPCSKTSSFAVHDAVLRVIGFTLLQPSDGEALQVWKSDDCDVPVFIERLQDWLASEERLFEASSGEPLVVATFVRLDSDGRVADVLAEAPRAER
eukprot:TRINITY_DN58328_c0_g1_i1.p1 TRINITY_DN58328_c0_g1~~TRINITY_DN58328_c0_g1_i1.p1  ORF type:complete len:430 (-),score=54.16 TRINITY_DN58328_c0_g1_i1:42-1331(-)